MDDFIQGRIIGQGINHELGGFFHGHVRPPVSPLRLQVRHDRLARGPVKYDIQRP
jgi:hypothetical protein